jgi:hypothetical protein
MINLFKESMEDRQRDVDRNWEYIEQREEAARLSAKFDTYVPPHHCKPEFGGGLKAEFRKSKEQSNRKDQQ